MRGREKGGFRGGGSILVYQDKVSTEYPICH